MNQPVAAHQFRAEGTPEPFGLYNPRNEHDACGIGLIAMFTGFFIMMGFLWSVIGE